MALDDNDKKLISDIVGEALKNTRGEISQEITGAVSRMSKTISDKVSTPAPADINPDDIKNVDQMKEALRVMAQERKVFKEENLRKAREGKVLEAMEKVNLDPSALSYIMVDFGSALTTLDDTGELYVGTKPLGDAMKEYAEGKGKRFRQPSEGFSVGIGPFGQKNIKPNTKASPNLSWVKDLNSFD